MILPFNLMVHWPDSIHKRENCTFLPALPWCHNELVKGNVAVRCPFCFLSLVLRRTLSSSLQGFSAATIELTYLVASETFTMNCGFAMFSRSSLLHNARVIHLGWSCVSLGSRWNVHQGKLMKTSANSFMIRAASVLKIDKNSDPRSQRIQWVSSSASSSMSFSLRVQSLICF